MAVRFYADDPTINDPPNFPDGIVIADLPIAVSHSALRVVRLTAIEFTGK
jgi:hypothetical protein